VADEVSPERGGGEGGWGPFRLHDPPRKKPQRRPGPPDKRPPRPRPRPSDRRVCGPIAKVKPGLRRVGTNPDQERQDCLDCGLIFEVNSFRSQHPVERRKPRERSYRPNRQLATGTLRRLRTSSFRADRFSGDHGVACRRRADELLVGGVQLRGRPRRRAIAPMWQTMAERGRFQCRRSVRRRSGRLRGSWPYAGSFDRRVGPVL